MDQNAADATHRSSGDRPSQQADSVDDLPPAPPRPRQRRFGGTAGQIQNSLTFYKIFAFVTGVMLLILVVKMVADYGFGLEAYVGGTVNGSAQTFGIYAQGAVENGTAVSYWISVIHGWVYVIYVIAGFRLWYQMRWTIGRLVTIVLGGVVPFLSFIVERKIAREVSKDIDANPQAVRRY